MDTTRRGFLAGAAAGAATKPPASPRDSLDGCKIARRHRIVRRQPGPDFFEGMLLGNGDIGVCVTLRPDALGLHLGKEDSWDIRVSEDHYRHVLPFQELLQLWRRAGDEAKRQGKPEMLFLERNIDFFREYTDKVTESYRKLWPRPWPCGIVWIHWDSRQVRLVEESLDISNGLLTLDMQHDDLRGSTGRFRISVFVNWNTGHISISTDVSAPFVSVAYSPYLEPEAMLPVPEIEARRAQHSAEFSCYQHFPATPPQAGAGRAPRTDKDRNFALYGKLFGAWQPEGMEESKESLRRLANAARQAFEPDETRPRVFFRSAGTQPFRLDLALFTPRDTPDNVARAKTEAIRLSGVPVRQLQAESEKGWRDFWSRSAVELEDKELERLWYHNQYWLACCLRERKVAPGLFGNWTSGKIGTAWHGDYHMNYNTQQVFWGVFSSNHVDQHLPYVELVEQLLPLGERYAKEKFGMPGAFYPHSAYPVPSRTIPYPAPPWGYELCETPWTVQSLWWHYLYTLDKEFLKRAYAPIAAAARFVSAYLTHGDDGKYHVIPSVSPENWGATVDFRLNKDCLVDLAMTEFLFDAAAEAGRILDRDPQDCARWREIRRNLAAYPTTKGPYGIVWADVAGAPAEWVYNVPATLAPVFPAEQVGIGLREQDWEIARRTASTVRLEGGNDVVYQPLIRARLAMLDLEHFKREVRYCQMPNGIVQDRVRQIDGRYDDSTDFDFMTRMGVWTENLSLPAVLNECMLQSYSGTLRLFPNTTGLGRARFHNLRAVGAFLVSAEWNGHSVAPVTIMSEKGAELKMANPWKAGVRVSDSRGGAVASREDALVIRFETRPGETYRVESA